MPKRSRPRTRRRCRSSHSAIAKLAAQSLEHALLMLLPQVWNHFGVAVLDEAMPARFELGSLLQVVEEFPIEDRHHIPFLVRDRLLAIRQADNA